MSKIESDKLFISAMLLANPETRERLMIGNVTATENGTVLEMADSSGKVVWKHTITTEEI